MRRVLFLFLDGVGLGSDDPAINPLAAADLPTLRGLIGGQPLTASTGRYSNGRAHLIPTDACLGVSGCPQSATGQTAILTGVNAPARLGEHHGPKPNQQVRDILDEASLFARLNRSGLPSYFCNAYPQRYFDAINQGKRLLSAVPYAAKVGGQTLLTADEMQAGTALSANFTGEGWRTELGYTDTPVYSLEEAGRKFWEIAQPYRFVFFEHWLTDMLGHRRQLEAAVQNFQRIDRFVAGLLAAADWAETLLIISSDHGNVENCSLRTHTENPALTLLYGADSARSAERVHGLDDFALTIQEFLS
jgi:2,3-bisphosphoglycerate-independent phosphoglycerate mutase